jgi:hypothetical protein
VLAKCSSQKKLQAILYSRHLMGALDKARGEINEALQLLPLLGVPILVSTRRIVGELHNQINSNLATKHEVADLIRAEMQRHSDSHAKALDVLIKRGVVSDEQDCADQLVTLQQEAERMRKEDKVTYDEEVLAWVMSFTAPLDKVKGSEGSRSAALLLLLLLLDPCGGVKDRRHPAPSKRR